MSERWLVEGEGRGRPVLLVHGNSMCAECFAPLLEKGFGDLGRTHALDLSGHGSRASHPSGGSFGEHLEQVRSAIGALGSGVVVVGHSLGGHLALETTDHPFVAGVIAIASPPIRSAADFERAFHPSPLFLEVLSEEQVEEATALLCGSGDRRVAQWIRATRPSARRELAQSLGRSEFRDEVRLIDESPVPVALVLCEGDRCVRNDYVRDLGLEDGLWGGAVHLIEGSSHMVTLDAPSELHALVSEFIGSL